MNKAVAEKSSELYKFQLKRVQELLEWAKHSLESGQSNYDYSHDDDSDHIGMYSYEGKLTSKNYWTEFKSIVESSAVYNFLNEIKK